MNEEYVPLSQETVQEGQVFGPISFAISHHTRDKTVQLIEEADLEGNKSIDFPYLMPSDMWGWARTLSRYFGRLNEVILAKSTWDILGKALPEEELTARAEIKRVVELKRLPFVQVETITRNKEDNPLLISNDFVLMLHGLEKQVYDGRTVTSPIPEDFAYHSRREIYFRHVWNETKWRNNIHTRDYAQKFGFKEELPEFITYMDNISAILVALEGEKLFDGTSIDLKRILPLYKGDIIDLYAERETEQGPTTIRAFLDGQDDERFLAVCTKK